MLFRKPLFASLAILALAVPVTSGTFVALSTSAAVAKGGNGKGGSDRGSRSDRGKPDRDRGSKGRSGQGKPGQGASGNGNGNGNAFGRTSTPKPAKTTAVVAPDTTTEAEVALHPSTLGSMNGAMNANINAVLAHIRNGNTNGPVGALAGLAVADHNAAGAQEVIDTAARFDALETALADAGYETLEDYQAAGESIEAIDAAVAALGEAAGEEAPSETDIADAEAALEALPEAEAAIFDAWNKSGDATEEEKAALLDALRERLEGEGDLIADTIDTVEDASADTEGLDDGAMEEDAAALDPETQAMIDGLTF